MGYKDLGLNLGRLHACTANVLPSILSILPNISVILGVLSNISFWPRGNEVQIDSLWT